MSDNINDSNDKNLTCSSWQNRNEVKKLIADQLCICNECISISKINDENTIDDLDIIEVHTPEN